MRIASQYVLAIGLSLILPLIVWISNELFPNIGWHFLTVTYITNLLLLILFYYLTSNYKVGRTLISFAINFIFWVLELVGLEMIFNGTWFYQDSSLSVIILGGVLWTTNKLILDFILGRQIGIDFSPSILERTIR